MPKTRYERAIERNLAEIERALFDLAAMRAIEKVKDFSANEVKVLYYALFNDYIAHCIKVLDQNRQSATFWYIFRSNEPPLRKFAKKHGIDFQFLAEIAEKLKHIRDGTHFHIDRDAVINPREVWRQANIKGSDLAKAVNQLWALLNVARATLGAEPIERPKLDEAALSSVAAMLESGEVPRK